MTYGDFIAELDRASLSIRAFATLVGMRPNSISNYASSGEVPGHLALIAALLSELKSHRIPFEAAIARAGPITKRSRGRGAPGRFGGDPQEQMDLGT
ncbi:MAG: DNA-binding protein [Devosia sp. 67-54]|uniref:XRE family transcriptional regulator n=1 Tax=unclassified Devosia TaxID=196773 RepID=UPI00095CE4D0|nr:MULTISPECIES: XRE family transcriptional regulator [unclassified Devosia]MBN9307209.1 XRE family transcriptional regulator [Devosia sp.]OJX19803.1 MAG: DNA-binding protein [Devosia sp. 67-54]